MAEEKTTTKDILGMVSADAGCIMVTPIVPEGETPMFGVHISNGNGDGDLLIKHIDAIPEAQRKELHFQTDIWGEFQILAYDCSMKALPVLSIKRDSSIPADEIQRTAIYTMDGAVIIAPWSSHKIGSED